MEAYQLWYALMYGVGVFVTCNVGGQILMRLIASPKRVKVVKGSDGDSRQWANAVDEHQRRFEEMRRQVDAGRADETPEESADETGSGNDAEESDANADAASDGSGAGTDGDSLPYGEGRYKLKAYGEGRYAGTA